MTLYKNLCIPANRYCGAITAWVVLGALISRTDDGTYRVTIGWYELWVGRRRLSFNRSWHHPKIKRELDRLLGR